MPKKQYEAAVSVLENKQSTSDEVLKALTTYAKAVEVDLFTKGNKRRGSLTELQHAVRTKSKPTHAVVVALDSWEGPILIVNKDTHRVNNLNEFKPDPKFPAEALVIFEENIPGSIPKRTVHVVSKGCLQPQSLEVKGKSATKLQERLDKIRRKQSAGAGIPNKIKNCEQLIRTTENNKTYWKVVTTLRNALKIPFCQLPLRTNVEVKKDINPVVQRRYVTIAGMQSAGNVYTLVSEQRDGIVPESKNDRLHLKEYRVLSELLRTLTLVFHEEFESDSEDVGRLNTLVEMWAMRLNAPQYIFSQAYLPPFTPEEVQAKLKELATQRTNQNTNFDRLNAEKDSFLLDLAIRGVTYDPSMRLQYQFFHNDKTYSFGDLTIPQLIAELHTHPWGYQPFDVSRIPAIQEVTMQQVVDAVQGFYVRGHLAETDFPTLNADIQSFEAALRASKITDMEAKREFKIVTNFADNRSAASAGAGAGAASPARPSAAAAAAAGSHDFQGLTPRETNNVTFEYIMLSLRTLQFDHAGKRAAQRASAIVPASSPARDSASAAPSSPANSAAPQPLPDLTTALRLRFAPKSGQAGTAAASPATSRGSAPAPASPEPAPGPAAVAPASPAVVSLHVLPTPGPG